MGIVYQKPTNATFHLQSGMGKYFEGKLIIFSAPSGAGKTTIVNKLLERINSLSFSVSCTTREKRDNEIDGNDYYFISQDDFEERIKSNDFIEYEEVYPGKYYGTLRSEIARLWKNGKHIIFDIDVQGGINLKSQFKEKALSFFVAPPSIEELEKRLINRNSESEETLKTRIEKAEQEMSFSKEFDRIIINEDLNEAVDEAEKIVLDFLK